MVRRRWILVLVRGGECWSTLLGWWRRRLLLLPFVATSSSDTLLSALLATWSTTTIKPRKSTIRSPRISPARDTHTPTAV